SAGHVAGDFVHEDRKRDGSLAGRREHVAGKGHGGFEGAGFGPEEALVPELAEPLVQRAVNAADRELRYVLRADRRIAVGGAKKLDRGERAHAVRVVETRTILDDRP